MERLNKKWHLAHPMPKSPTPQQRLKWHLDHIDNCDCRGLPSSILKIMEERGIPVSTPVPERAREHMQG